ARAGHGGTRRPALARLDSRPQRHHRRDRGARRAGRHARSRSASGTGDLRCCRSRAAARVDGPTAQDGGRPKRPPLVKITQLTTYLVGPRWLFLRIDTDEGISGWGEPIVEGRAETVRAAVAEVGELLIGEDPSRIEDHWQRLTKGGFYRGGPILSSAVAG